MKEGHEAVGQTVFDLHQELLNPSGAPFENLGWTVDVKEVDGRFTVALHNPKKGTIKQVGVRVIHGSGKSIQWDQPVFIENPGCVIVPIRKRAYSKGSREQIILYFLVTRRPVVESRLNFPIDAFYETQQIDVRGISNIAGLTLQNPKSIEFPRGIGDKAAQRFNLDAMYRSQRLLVVGNEDMFIAMGGEDVMEHEVNALELMPGTQPLFTGPLCPNTALFQTNQAGFLCPVSPINSSGDIVVSGTAQALQIENIIPVLYPQETDKILEESQERARSTVWDSEQPVLFDMFTLAMFPHIERYIRQGKVPVTG